VLELSSGKYFVWAADHALWYPSFISRCISVLEQDPTVVLVYPRTTLIDSNGNELEITPDRGDTEEKAYYLLAVAPRYE
jgi:hypothetical protein